MAITNGYATLAQVKAALRITDSIDDTLIELAVESASRDIDAYCARVFYNVGSASRYYAAIDPYFCGIDDAISISEVKTSSTSNGVYDVVWANPGSGENNGDFQTEPVNAAYPTDGIAMPITGLRALWNYLFPIAGGAALVKVTGVWGWSSVPTAIKQACVIQAARIFKRNDSPLGVAGFGDMGAMRVSRVDPDVARMLEPYRRVNGFM
jgi:hypothetical protein